MVSHSPFESRPANQLVSLSTGRVTDDSINCDDAAAIGRVAIRAMVGKPYLDVKLRQKDKVKSIAAMKNNGKLHDEDVTVNPQ